MIVKAKQRKREHENGSPQLWNEHIQFIIMDYPSVLKCGTGHSAVLWNEKECGWQTSNNGAGGQGHANGSPRGAQHQIQDDPEPYSINLVALSVFRPRARIASEYGCLRPRPLWNAPFWFWEWKDSSEKTESAVGDKQSSDSQPRALLPAGFLKDSCFQTTGHVVNSALHQDCSHLVSSLYGLLSLSVASSVYLTCARDLQESQARLDKGKKAEGRVKESHFSGQRGFSPRYQPLSRDS